MKMAELITNKLQDALNNALGGSGHQVKVPGGLDLCTI
jgi:hypothetical protein